MPTTAEKADIIAALDAAGVPEIELTGFVHPRVIPSLADAEAVAALATAAPHRAVLRALVPNLHGARRAVDAETTKLVGLIVASETYQRLNANMSVEEKLEHLARIKDEGHRCWRSRRQRSRWITANVCRLLPAHAEWQVGLVEPNMGRRSTRRVVATPAQVGPHGLLSAEGLPWRSTPHPWPARYPTAVPRPSKKSA